MGRTCTICDHADRAQLEIGLANGIALRVLGLRYGVNQNSLWRHRSKHMDADLVAKLKTRGCRSDEELAQIREIEGKSLLDNLVWQRARLIQNADRAVEIKDWAGERSAIEAASKVSERIAKLLGEMGSAITVNNVQFNLVASPQWHHIRTAIVRELRPLGLDAIAAGARAIAAAETAILQPVEDSTRLIEVIPHE